MLCYQEEETQLTMSESGGDGGSNEEPETLSGAADTQVFPFEDET